MFSGDQCTTGGNSARTFFYWWLAAEMAGVPLANWAVFVAGDDSVLFLTRRYVKAFRAAITRLFLYDDPVVPT